MQESDDANRPTVRANSYFIATTQGECGSCARPTLLVALALPRDHEIWYEAELDGSFNADDQWQNADGEAFLFFIARLNAAVERHVRAVSPHFHPQAAELEGSSAWCNHCSHCGAPLSDADLHCEFDGAFVPTSDAAAAQILLIRIQEPLTATAGGYTSQPEFFAVMRRV